jgi:diguanylate cyclase (GGDEF)-like protein/PAS domain S-box-containing protein
MTTMRFPNLRRLSPDRLSLKSRVALMVALLFASAIGMQAWLTLRHFAQEYREVVSSRLYDMAKTMAENIDNKLLTYRDMVVAAARALPPQALRDPELAQRFLDQQVALKTVLDNGLLLVSEEGRIIADSRGVPGLRGRDVRHLDVFQGVSAARAPYISRPFTSLREGRQHAMSIGVPIFDAQGRMVGRLHGSLDLHGKNFLADLADYRIGRTGYVGLVTRDRLILVHQDKTRIMQWNKPGQNALVDRAIDGFEGSGRTRNMAGAELLSSVKHLRATDWILVVNMSAEEAEAPLRQALSYLTLSALGLAAGVLALVWFIMHRALTPLATLTRHVRELPGKRGSERQLQLRTSGEMATLVRAFNDQVQVSDRQQASLQESETRFRSLAEMSTDWYWEQDAQFRFTLVSRGLDKSGISPSIGKARWELPIVGVTSDQWAEHRAMLERHEPFRDFAYQVRDAQGGLRTLTISGVPIFDAQGRFTGYRGIGTDITQRKAAEQRIEYLAYHDALTGLPNRLLVQDRFEQAMAQAERTQARVALVYLDLDNFKSINDTLGHAAGDEFLQEVARRLRECLRDTDTISRLGGDEFLLVLRDLPDAEIVSIIVLKLMEQLQLPFQLGTHEVSSSASIGVAIAPQDGRDFETLRKKADLAMYRSKEAGRNAYHFFDPTMDAEAGEHLIIRNGLRRALERDELVLHYQPQYELLDGRLSGAETLLRWQHPELGLVPPGRFITVAEESGLIVPIGDWVLREACRQAAQWRRDGLPPLTISVNLSAIQFKRGEVEKSVTAALAASGLDPAQLELELTESILIQNAEGVLASVRRLKQLGVKLAIDDFGTGYSSLSYLKRFEVDRLKIDQSFVRDLPTDSDDAAIVRAIVQMSHSLNLMTVAEGVETGEVAQQLRAFGCDQAQGYYFARPLPAEQIEALLRQATTP